ncbi:MAG: hypothetical protein WC761_05645 [Candidatus Paceibacterota bacterium]|jgi:hypothetical protein
MKSRLVYMKHYKLVNISMTTVINNPSSGDNSGSSVSIIIAIIVIILLAWAFIVYGLPMIRGGQAPADNATLNVNLQVPTGESGGGATQ